MRGLDDAARAFSTFFDFEPSLTGPLHLLLLIEGARHVVAADGFQLNRRLCCGPRDQPARSAALTNGFG